MDDQTARHLWDIAQKGAEMDDRDTDRELRTCVFDNPASMARECWQDGRLLYSYSIKVLHDFAHHPIPGRLFFFGANVGPWKAGQLLGDAAAMGEN